LAPSVRVRLRARIALLRSRVWVTIWLWVAHRFGKVGSVRKGNLMKALGAALVPVLGLALLAGCGSKAEAAEQDTSAPQEAPLRHRPARAPGADRAGGPHYRAG
jgi:hypothetical protein